MVHEPETAVPRKYRRPSPQRDKTGIDLDPVDDAEATSAN